MNANTSKKTKTFLLAAALIAAISWGLPYAAQARLSDSPPSSECRRLGVPIMGIEKVCEGTAGVDPDNGIAYGKNLIFAYMIAITRFLSVGVGLVVTLMIVISGVQYVSSAGNSQKIEAAKTKLRHAVEALVLFIFLSALINWLIPGGLL